MMRAAAVALVSAVLLLAGCSGSSDEPSASPSPTTSSAVSPSTSASASFSASPAAEVPEAPKVGSCYRLSLSDAARPTNDSRPVDCSKPNTARTYYVGKLDTVVDGHSLGVDSDHVQQQLAETCPKELASFLGGTTQARELSRFQAIWFSPTVEQYDAGADWFRCDVVAVAQPDKLLDLPSDQKLQGILNRGDALATYGLCGTAQPGSKGFERVACALPHSWVAISTIPIAGGDRYPGVDAVKSAGDKACSDQVRSRAGLPLKWTYGWEWPTTEQWTGGQHYGFCWAPKSLA